VQAMLVWSDNDMAEGLLRLTAVAKGKPANWSGGVAAEMAILKKLGIPTSTMVVKDGSGLSRSNRIPAATLASIAKLFVDPAQQTTLWPIMNGLPVAGKTGSLSPVRGRFNTAPSRCATGLIHGKTGHLSDVVTLAGVAKGADGKQKIFAFE